MKKAKIYFIELSAQKPDGSRATIRRELFGTFTTAGNAHLTLKLLKESTYKNLLEYNKNGVNPNAPMYLLNIEY